MDKRIFVISDLHLGGKPGFQMCSARGQERLADFIDWCTTQQGGNLEVHLVLNGDIVDFLAEEPFAEFTGDERLATQKLASILQRTSPIWSALQRLLQSGAVLSLLLGNHDLELSLPLPRRQLYSQLGSGRLEFLYDNQALRVGALLVDHGNRHDAWNVVQHDALRRVRASLSLMEEAPEFTAPAGSKLVVNVINSVKSQPGFDFVDLLKPERSGVLPLLGLLKPSAFAEFHRLAQAILAAGSSVEGALHRSWKTGSSVADACAAAERQVLLDAMQLARQLSDAPAPGATGPRLDYVKQLVDDLTLEPRIDALCHALQFFAQRNIGSFQTDYEDPAYLRPARAAAEGLRRENLDRPVVIYGHTHLARRVPLDGGGLYLNTGTWADLMYLPESLLGQNFGRARQDLAGLVAAIRNGQIAQYRRLIPSYARIDFDGERITDADIWLFRSTTRQDRLPAGSLWSCAE